MNKATLIERIARATGLSKKQATDALESTLNIIIESLKKGEEVRISGFGVFSSMLRHARKGVNPQNPSEPIAIPEVRVAKFKTGKTLKDAMKNN